MGAVCSRRAGPQGKASVTAVYKARGKGQGCYAQAGRAWCAQEAAEILLCEGSH